MDEELKRNEDPIEQGSLPPTIQMAKNFVKAAAKHIADGFAKVSVDQYKARIAVCNKNECNRRVKNRCTHPKCGCFIDVKAWWASEDCPDTPPHWPRLDQSET